jgi:hypothetical protein
MALRAGVDWQAALLIWPKAFIEMKAGRLSMTPV